MTMTYPGTEFNAIDYSTDAANSGVKCDDSCTVRRHKRVCHIDMLGLS